uniref:Uncharacterized protein n=1 Tax=Aegilops tauschii TaxID=37682 RepID=N1QW53_AEGTA
MALLPKIHPFSSLVQSGLLIPSRDCSSYPLVQILTGLGPSITCLTGRSRGRQALLSTGHKLLPTKTKELIVEIQLLGEEIMNREQNILSLKEYLICPWISTISQAKKYSWEIYRDPQECASYVTTHYPFVIEPLSHFGQQSLQAILSAISQKLEYI